MKKLMSMLFGAGLTVILASCGNGGKTFSGIEIAKFDTVVNEKPVQLFTLTNKNKMEVCITNFGARVVSLMAKDRNGAFVDVVLGYDNIAQYMDSVGSPNNFGALTGGKDWEYQVFDAEQIDKQTLKLTLNSPEEGTVTATYKLTDDNALDCTFEAASEKENFLVVSNNNYFTLTGDPSQAGTNMILRIYADKFIPVDTTFAATGKLRDCYGSSMDFNKGRALYELIGDTTEHQIKIADGFNHNYVLNSFKNGKGENMIAASLYAENTGIFLEVFTNEPTIKVYSANKEGTGVTGKNGVKYPKHVSVSLAPQIFPKAPAKAEWTSTTLKPGEPYKSHTIYRFSTK
ncbi:MAG: galactose-1-epimerase [Prevotella sp.]|nr:galactose-1-epimerase [Prevotella sp.]MBR6494591.1 galactose-1-epimerase [Prevotella sp.]